MQPVVLPLRWVAETFASTLDATDGIASRGSPLAHEGEGVRWVVPVLFPMEALREQGDPTDEHQANLHDRSYLWHRGKIRDDIKTSFLLYPFRPPLRPR